MWSFYYVRSLVQTPFEHEQALWNKKANFRGYFCRALDVSQSKDGPVLYRNPENHLRDLVSGLPYLNWLDIAGTNLAGFLSPACHSHKTEKQYSDDSEVAGSPHTCRLKR